MKMLRMFVTQGDEAVEVGRCHPGQARIMEKRGVAEIRDGKVWLAGPPPQGVYINIPKGIDPLVVFEMVSDALGPQKDTNFPDWTPFNGIHANLTPQVVSWDFPKEADHPLLRDSPNRPLTPAETEELRKLMVLAPFPKHEDLAENVGYSVFGCYRIVENHLFRVWYWKGSCTWDESVLLPDGRYLFITEGRHVDPIYTGDTSKIALMAPGGFIQQIEAADSRIVEFMCTRNHPEERKRDEERIAEVLRLSPA